MLERKKNIIFISKTKLIVSEVTLAKTSTVKILAEYNWTINTIAAIAQAIKKTVHGSVRVLVGEDSSYVFAIPLPQHSGKEHLRQLIKEKAQLLIPDNLDESVWDFKEDNENGRPIVQIVSFTKEIVGAIKSFVLNSNLTIEAVEPFSSAAARLTQSEPQLHYILMVGSPSIFIFCYKGFVFASYLIDDTKFAAAFAQINLFVTTHFNLEVWKIVISADNSHAIASAFQAKRFEVTEKNLDPRIGLALKQDIKGEDEDVLNFDFATNKKTQNNVNKYLGKITIIFVFIIFVLLILILLKFKGE